MVKKLDLRSGEAKNRMKQSQIMVEIAPGELLDKISILEIKRERIKDPAKLANVAAELALLARVQSANIAASSTLDALCARLKKVNEILWETEDDIREEEREQRFGARFIALARMVYHTNDERAAIKREINVLLGSAIIEEKSYTNYA